MQSITCWTMSPCLLALYSRKFNFLLLLILKVYTSFSSNTKFIALTSKIISFHLKVVCKNHIRYLLFRKKTSYMLWHMDCQLLKYALQRCDGLRSMLLRILHAQIPIRLSLFTSTSIVKISWKWWKVDIETSKMYRHSYMQTSIPLIVTTLLPWA